jgi:Family of unknown function (DUF6519)
MTADIARITYDPTRQYRSVLRQQGRVTLEADENEAAVIEVEALRLETVDLIGPAVAVGGGYAVSTSGSTITIALGVFYLGGWRLELDAKVDWANQPDWLDADPAGATVLRTPTAVIALLASEQSVCAVEDQALREVALGGPDSAARARLMQHFLRIPIEGNTCADGAATVNQLLGEDGVTLGPDLQLLSQALLQAGFVPGPPNTDACTPVAAGGYLGADNQLIRVTVKDYDSNSGTGTLLWGWNNASLLYRATEASDPYTLTLTNVPVDEEHAPQLGQWVEILRAEADLGDDNFIADSQGFVTDLDQGYSFDTGEIVLHDALPTAYQDNKPPLFVRLWQAAVPFTTGQVTALDSVSGITVTVTLPALPSQIAGRPFWRFAVRPATPQAIYPPRYLEAPQPPDGPRQWITDLAVVSSSGGALTVIDDCRVPLGPKTTQECDCCGVVLGPDDVAARGGLQQVIDGLVQSAVPARLSLKSGTYALAQTLVLGAQHSNLILEGCTDGVIITAGGKDASAFATGLIRLDGVTDLTLRGLTLRPTTVGPPIGAGGMATMAAVVITSVHALSIEDCNFDMFVQASQPFGGAVIVLGRAERVALRRNIFDTRGARSTPLFGVLGWVAGNNAATLLDDWEIDDNHFSMLQAAVWVIAQLGVIRCCDNLIVNCGSGIVLAEANLGATNAFASVALQESARLQGSNLAQAASTLLRPDLMANVISLGAPLVAALALPPPCTVSKAAQQVLTEQVNARGAAAFASLTGRPKSGAAKSAKAAPGAATVNLAGLEAATLAAEMFEQPLIPAVRIEDNEITLATVLFSNWIGIAVLHALPQPRMAAPATAIISGNRVATPNSTVTACGLAFPSAAIINGNILAQQSATQNGQNFASLIVISSSPMLQIAGNVVQFGEWIFPSRLAPAPTPSWEFFNTVE